MKNYYLICLVFFFVENTFAQNSFFFEIIDPTSIAICHPPEDISIPDFGGIVINDVVGELVYAPADVDGNRFLCDIPATDFTDKLVLIDRGACTFGEKAFNAQERGAIGVVIRNIDEQLISFVAGPIGQNVTIPLILIPHSMADGIEVELSNGNSVTAAFKVNCTVRTEVFQSDLELNIFPNPMKEVSVIELLGKDFKNGKIEVFDLLGKRIREESFSQSTFYLQRKDLQIGNYFFQIWLDDVFSASGKIQIMD